MTTAILHPDNDALLRRGWAALPASYRMPDVAPTLEEARAWCKQLAESHYENFHVATWFLPKALRPHFYAIYAYCRISDDLGDEIGDTSAALALLDLWAGNWTAAMKVTRAIPSLSLSLKPFVPVPFPSGRLLICSPHSARTRSSRVMAACRKSSSTAAIPRTP